MSETHHDTNYVKIWSILVVLLIISVVGPLFGVRVVTVVTAFGIAFVKAYLVAKNFMHLNIEKRFVVYLLTTCLAFMLLFFTAVAPDVMRAEGHQWKKPVWLEESAQAPSPEDPHDEH